jgi:small-conductance mechanosensitive channel
MVLRFLVRFFVPLFWVVITLTPGMAADVPVPATADSAAPVLPGLSELGGRSSQLTAFVEKADDRLLQLADVERISDGLKELDSKTQEMRQKIATLGSPDDWYADRLIQYNSQFGQVRGALADIQGELVRRQQEIEKIRARHLEERNFWKAWGAELKTQGVKVPSDTIKQITAQLTQLDSQITEASEKLLPVQERASALERSVIEELDHFSKALTHLRKATFRKNAHSFLAPEFYAEFGPGLWQELNSGVRAAISVDTEFLQRNAWVYLLFFLALILLAKSLQEYRARFAGAEEWQFVLGHPWAAGSFVAAVIFGNLFAAPTAILKFALMVVGVTGATVLAAALLQSRRRARVLILAACVLLLTTALRLIAFPQPLFRIYIAILALVSVPVLIWNIRLSMIRNREHGGFFRALLRVAIAVMVLSLGGQVAGYVNFSIWLLQAAFETGMVMLFVHMALRLGNGGIDFLLNLERISSRKFFKKFHHELATRLEFFLKILVSFYALLNLLPVWRIFGSLGEAWDYLANFSLTVGEFRITPQMIGLAVVTLYLAMQLSWLLQAVCETQIFYRKSVDRGVRDAIKKLVHYGVVLVGFLVALSVLGMSLQNFVVVLGALGVGIGFGLQDIVNNFLSGIIMLFERPVKVGDGILVDGEYGTVKYIGLRSTIVETLDQSELIVPNAHMISQKVTNWTLSSRRVRIVMPVGVAYGSEVPLVMTILAEVAGAHQEVLADPEPTAIFVAFGESSLDFELRVWIDNIDGRPRIKSELLLQIDARFRAAGVEIPFPQRDLHVRSVDSSVLGEIKPT